MKNNTINTTKHFLNLFTSFQAVDILRIHPEKLTLVVKQTHKIVCQIGLVIARIQLLGQGKEGSRVVMEIVNLKYGFCIRQVILLEVVIETTPWGSVK